MVLLLPCSVTANSPLPIVDGIPDVGLFRRFVGERFPLARTSSMIHCAVLECVILQLELHCSSLFD